jgi:prevent-host-death family protein
MSKVTAFEAKTRFGELLERVARGEEIVITRHDKPVARIVPEGQPRAAQVQVAVASLKGLRDRIRTRTRGRSSLSDADVRAAIVEGRR